jgi:hypothetical protein
MHQYTETTATQIERAWIWVCFHREKGVSGTVSQFA